MKEPVSKLSLILLLIIMVIVMLPGCSGNTTENGEKSVNTDLGRMLGFVPYSFLEEHDIWFGDPGAAKELYGLDHLNSLEALEQLPVEERREAMGKIGGIYVPQSTGNYYQLAPLIGFDSFMINRAIFNDTPPPWGFSVIEGNFDEVLIAGKLTEQGYEQAEYGSYTYYWKNDDMKVDIRSEIGGQVLAQLNRVAVLDDMLVIAPATGIMTGVLDSMTGDASSVIGNTACQALADSLGDVLTAVLITPDRVMKLTPTQPAPPFDFAAAADWGTLHQYDMLGIGYRDDGEERYWDISLYYDDTSAAAADADELVSRLESYVFYTHIEPMENVPLTSKWEIGEPVVREYPDGATLTVSCRYLTGTTGSGSIFMVIVQARDFLFLAPDPSQYIAE